MRVLIKLKLVFEVQDRKIEQTLDIYKSFVYIINMER